MMRENPALGHLLQLKSEIGLRHNRLNLLLSCHCPPKKLIILTMQIKQIHKYMFNK